MTHFMKHKLTFDCLEDTAKLMNSMPGTTVKIPETKYTLLKAFNLFNTFKHQYHIYCKNCKHHAKYLPNDNNQSTWACVKCDAELKLAHKTYFVYINLQEQLQLILSRHWEKIEAYNAVIQEDDCENIRDTYSGTLISTSLKKKVTQLSLMINTDGLCTKKSSNSSVWPLQIICNFLPPRIRYLKENILCVAFYSDIHKPDMPTFLSLFLLRLNAYNRMDLCMKNNYSELRFHVRC